MEKVNSFFEGQCHQSFLSRVNCNHLQLTLSGSSKQSSFILGVLCVYIQMDSRYTTNVGSFQIKIAFSFIWQFFFQEKSPEGPRLLFLINLKKNTYLCDFPNCTQIVKASEIWAKCRSPCSKETTFNNNNCAFYEKNCYFCRIET